MLVQDSVKIGGLDFMLNEGDIVNTAEQNETAVDQTAGGTTLTGVAVAGRFVRASGNIGAVNTTLPTAEQILAALRGSMGRDVPPANSPYGPNVAPEKEFPSDMGIISPRSTFNFTLINGNAGINTLVAQANSGVSISGTATVAANVWRQWLVRILASAPTAIVPVTTTNASPTLSNVDKSLLNKLQVGMSAYGVGIGASAKIAAINRDLGTVTLDVNSTATADNIAVTFTPTVTFTNRVAGTI